ncbi:MAG TPA: RNA polymerase sigma factor [Gemmatimonadaceae bacterium]|jgi:RNA polymerase sigma-70 factor (ECF subfamily)
MRPFRFGKRKRPDSESVATVAYHDRASRALDAQLASLASAGDDAAFTALVTRFQPAVFRWSLTFAADPDEAEDITQEVFVRAHRQLGQYRSDGSLDAWLYQITRRASLQTRRTRKRRGRLALAPAAQPLRDVYTTDPGGRVDRQRAAAIVRELFEKLPRRQREIFDLVDLQGLSPAEAAERTGLRPVSVRANLFKARKTIRETILATHPSYRELAP